jgi:hypothetical protein
MKTHPISTFVLLGWVFKIAIDLHGYGESQSLTVYGCDRFSRLQVIYQDQKLDRLKSYLAMNEIKTSLLSPNRCDSVV